MQTLPRVLTAAQAIERGYTPSRIRTELRHGRWRRITSGVLLTRPEPAERRDLVTAGLLLGGVGSALSGWDAIALYGIPAARNPTADVLVLTSRGENRVVTNIRLRRTVRAFEWRYVSVDGSPIRVATPARVVADAALDCTRLETARAMITSAVQRQLCSVEELANEYDTGPRNRSYFLRRALADITDGARSVAEATAADSLRAARVPRFEMNEPILNRNGRVVFIADFLWRTLRAVLEIDSKQHHFFESDWRATMRRHNALTAAGYAVTHWAPAEIVADPTAFGNAVRLWLSTRAAELQR